MKNAPIILAFASYLLLCASPARADQLDDLISGMRKGVTVDAGQKAEIIKTAQATASNSYLDSIVNLYLCEIKASIIDPANNNGWPCRSFLLEGNPSLRKHLTKALKDRFEEKPDSVLVYSAICPAIYAGDDKLVDRLQSYLKDHDSFLFNFEQGQIDSYWRPYIKNVIEKEAVGNKTGK
jgi:hypothetical protein